MTWYGSAHPEPPDRRPDDAETEPISRPPQSRWHGQTEFSVTKLWTGGVVTALIEALLAVVGFLVVNGILGMEILGVGPKDGVYSVTMAGYALAGAFVALVATAVMHLLLVGTPRPLFYFAWIGALCTAILVLIPISLVHDWSDALPTAVNNAIGGIVITVIVRGTAAASITGRRRLPPVR